MNSWVFPSTGKAVFTEARLRYGRGVPGSVSEVGELLRIGVVAVRFAAPLRKWQVLASGLRLGYDFHQGGFSEADLPDPANSVSCQGGLYPMELLLTIVQSLAVRPARNGVCRRIDGHRKQKTEYNIMKLTNYIILSLVAVLAIGCDKQKTAIEENKEATKEAIDMRKTEVDKAAKDATRQTDVNATIDKARIEANKDSIQAQLDADKKKADAQAEADKAKVDAENK